MKFDMIVTDYDGTFGDRYSIDNETLNAVNKFVDRGGKFVICTGRMLPAITGICEQYNIRGVVVSYQGALIYDVENKKTIREGGFNSEFAVQVVRDMRAENIDFVVDIDNKMYCEKDTMYTEYHKEFTDVVKVDNLENFLIDNKDKTVYKVIATGQPEKVAFLTKKYNELYKGRAICNNGSDLLMEVIHPDYSKGASVRFLSKYYNIPFDKIMAVGDSTNDIELIRGEWHGVAVGDGKEQLKAVAKEVTVPFKDKPIKVLIEKYCL